MTDKNLLFILFSAFILISSCDEQLPEEEAISDPITNPITNPQFVFMRESNFLYFLVSCEIDFEGDSLSSILVEWYGQEGTNKDSIWLNDEGIFGDLILNDGMYSRKIPNDPDSVYNIIQSNLIGEVSYKILVNYGVNKFELFQTTYVQNIPPIILSVSAPDTIIRPSGTEPEFVLITADVVDVNGLDDILNCGFKSLHVEPDTLLYNGNLIALYDDGSEVDLCPDYSDGQCPSGDILKNDGTFSRIVPIYGTDSIDPELQTKTGTFLWTFTAKDNSNEPSEPVEHVIIVE
jgi:hypothetical protein